MRIVSGVGVAALLATVAVVALLSADESDDAREPATRGTASDGTTIGVADETIDGAAVFASNCAQCHGVLGEGGSAPALAGGRLVQAFPDVDNQIAFVKAGGGGMPSFRELLSDAEIEAVVEYTRSEL